MLTPYYENKYGVLYHGDCLEIMPQLETKFDMILADPPYGTTECKWDNVIPFESMWQNIKAVRNNNTPIVLFGSEPFSSLLRCSNLKEYKYDWIFAKTMFSNFLNLKYEPKRDFENISIFYIKRPTFNPQLEHGKKYHKNCFKTSSQQNYGIKRKFEITNNGYRFPSSILQFNNGNNNNVHPTQKPVSLLEYLIKTYTNENNIVLDFCAGSCSTAVACILTNRRFVMIEQEEQYCEVSVKRMEQALYDVSMLR